MRTNVVACDYSHRSVDSVQRASAKATVDARVRCQPRRNGDFGTVDVAVPGYPLCAFGSFSQQRLQTRARLPLADLPEWPWRSRGDYDGQMRKVLPNAG